MTEARSAIGVLVVSIGAGILLGRVATLDLAGWKLSLVEHPNAPNSAGEEGKT